ncbi:hypothetical protein AVEN_101089-1, partial [Araneus ventricosus]
MVKAPTQCYNFQYDVTISYTMLQCPIKHQECSTVDSRLYLLSMERFEFSFVAYGKENR